jgi:hypothetical protein
VIAKLKTNGFAFHLLELERPKKKEIIKPEPPTCLVCRLSYVHNHITWCCRQTDGYTCQCSIKLPATPDTLLWLDLSIQLQIQNLPIDPIASPAKATPILNLIAQPVIADSAKNKLWDIKSWIA